MPDGPPDRLPGDLPRSPTGRIPQWVIDEARAGHRAPDATWRGPTESERIRLGGPYLGGAGSAGGPPAYQANRPRRRRVSAFVAFQLVAVLIVVMGTSFVMVTRVREDGWDAFGPDAVSFDQGGVATVGRPVDWPTPPQDVSPTPLATPEPLTVTSDAHDFVWQQEGGRRPVAYDPCRPISYVIRAEDRPDGADELVAEAITRLSRATGLVFLAEGTTDEPATGDRPVTDPERYGDRWAPVLIAWQTEEARPELAGPVLGIGGSTYVSRTGLPQVFVTGEVVLDADESARLIARGEEGVAVLRAVLLHELGHLVGLDHVDDPTQLMYPQASTGVLDFAAGDLTGLAALGDGVCVPQY